MWKLQRQVLYVNILSFFRWLSQCISAPTRLVNLRWTTHLLCQILWNLLRVTHPVLNLLPSCGAIHAPEYTEVDILCGSLFTLAPIIPVDIFFNPEDCR
ncbi:hypothetical protein BDQ94DRAFT_76098 [Aspergillus welwitschiae]|uniref:Secreted protein n=1 Tax=Aspergillus welwitschiae TaxID=1341132 RepID=A0A3F3PUA5_9EURO|nr:hypothetical protein BDQ94DRAFT_76098 [Aspergillus welwitschiae]RDH30408.1 hypothetical protein BDQ94DRAFT_76098 [Aspergillus welwitschiae]